MAVVWSLDRFLGGVNRADTNLAGTGQGRRLYLPPVRGGAWRFYRGDPESSLSSLRAKSDRGFRPVTRVINTFVNTPTSEAPRNSEGVPE